MVYFKAFSIIVLSIFASNLLLGQIDTIFKSRKNVCSISYINQFAFYRDKPTNYPPIIKEKNEVSNGDSSFIYYMPKGVAIALEHSFYPKNEMKKYFFSTSINYTFDHSKSEIYVSSRLNGNGSRITKEIYNRNTFWTSFRFNYQYRKWLATLGLNMLIYSNQSTRQFYLDGTSIHNLNQNIKMQSIQPYISLLTPIAVKQRLFIRGSASRLLDRSILMAIGLEWSLPTK